MIFTGTDLHNSRQLAGLSRQGLAEMCGLHRNAVYYWERKPRLDMRGYACLKLIGALHNFWTLHARGHGVLVNAQQAKLKKDRAPVFNDHLTGWTDERPAKIASRLCGATTRRGTPCQRVAEATNGRCRLHGGFSTGPKTVEGKDRIAQAQRHRWARWRASRTIN